MSCRFFAALVSLLLCALPASAQFRTVTVQNANDNPVPATIQNTPSVNVANTPTVSVSGTVNTTISGTPNVNATITGTPAVTVTNLPTGTGGPASATALVTKSLDNPALQPLQKRLNCQTVTQNSCQATFTVPLGKQLVIEYLQLSSFEGDPAGHPTFAYSLMTTAGGDSELYSFAPGPRVSADRPLAEHQVRIYADAGSTVVFEGLTQPSTTVVANTFFLLLSGHLVNVP